MQHKKKFLVFRILPWLVTGAIFAVLFQRVPLPELLQAWRQIHFLPYLALMVPYSVLYCTLDAFVLWRVLLWFHGSIPYRRVLPVRAAAYILALLNPGLGQGGVAWSLHRREGIPFLEIAGSMLFLVVMECVQLALYAALGIFVLQPHLGVAFVPVYAVLGIVVGIALLYVHRGIEPLSPLLTWWGRYWRHDATYRYQLRKESWPILRTFQRARGRHYGLTLLYKAPNFLLAVVIHTLALQLFGVEVPFGVVFTFLPVIFLAASLPITVAHLGTSQAAWVYFFSAYGEASQLLAYSLVAHVTFMLLNGLIGLCFLPQALRGLDDLRWGQRAQEV